jgi:TetR/AcrR family transcriptional regulator, cholesterol catabolism regulator
VTKVEARKRRRRSGTSRELEVPAVGKRNGVLPRELIDVAARSFMESGYVAASLTGVAERFGILKGSLYHYIETKDDLLFAIVYDAHEQAEIRNVRWRDESDPLKAIEIFITDHVQIALDNITYTIVYTREFRRLSPERLRTIGTKRSAYERNLRSLIAAAKKAGEVRSDIDPKLATQAIFGLMNWVYVWYGSDKRFEAEEVVEQLRRQALAILVP